MKQGKKITVYWRLTIGFAVAILAIIALSFLKSFCDFYADSVVYRSLSDAYMHVSSIASFSVGELLIVITILGVFCAIIVSLVGIQLAKHKGYIHVLAVIWKSFFMASLVVLLLYGIFYLLPFRSTVLYGRKEKKEIYTEEHLRLINAYLVEQANALAKELDRDAKGNLILTTDCQKALHKSMNDLSKEFPRLKGYYGPVKNMKSSALLNWMDIGGVTFPFVKEAVYNRYISDLYFPTLAAHELAHNKGYYKENEAEFLGIISCINSDNAYVRYSGYIYGGLDVIDELYRMEEAFYEINSLEAEFASPEGFDYQVYADVDYSNIVAQEAYQEEVSEVIEDAFSAPASEVADVGWNTQAKILKEYNYDGVIKLLFAYYEGKLY